MNRDPRRILLLVLGLVLGAFMGRVVTHVLGSSFVLPDRPDQNRWRVISPGLNEGIGQAGAGRTTHITDGALTIASHVFFRPDMVVPQFLGDAATVEIDLAPDSDVLWVQMGPPPGIFLGLLPERFRVTGSDWQQADGTGEYRLHGNNGVLSLENGGQQVVVGSFTPGRIEMSTAGGWGRVERFRVQDVSGASLFEADFRSRGVGARALNKGTMLGAFAGLFMGFLLFPLSWARSVSAGLCLVPVLCVVGAPRTVWLVGVERLYLSTTPPSAMASAALCFSLVPLVCMVVVRVIRMGWNPAPERSVQGPAVWWISGLVALALVARQDPSQAALIGTVVFMLLGALRFRGHGVNAWWWIDSLCWVSIAVFGLAQGIFLAVSWRLLMVLGTTRWWLDRSPRTAVDVLLLCFIALPLSAEVLVRDTVLGASWDAGRLSDERPNEKGWDDPVPGWTGRCGPEDAQKTVRVVVGGGSSVGGAYQFRDEPEAFFTARAHQELCEALPADTALKSANFGDGDRNSFTISRTVEEHFAEADFLLIYVGVNDLFTTQNSLTRKQREARLQARSTAEAGLASFARESRLVAGAALLVRAVPDPGGRSVADVPLADAVENHQTLVDAAGARGAQVVFMTEHVQSWRIPNLVAYSRMQQQFADTHDHVHWIDAGAAFTGMSDTTTLVDSNHLSREGNRILGKHLALQLAPLLFDQGSSL